MQVKLPAQKLCMGVREVYSVVMKVKDYVNLFTVNDNPEIPIEERMQRRPNRTRGKQIAAYLKRRRENWFFNSVVCSFEGRLHFAPIAKTDGAGWLTGELGNTIINDGQHRTLGFAEAIADIPELGECDVSVLLVHHRSIQDAQQIFTDLNRYPKVTPRGLNLTFDREDIGAEITRRVAVQVPIFKGMIESETGGSLSRKSSKLTTNVALHTCIEGIRAPVLLAAPDDYNLDDPEAAIKKQTAFVVETFKYLCGPMKSWTMISKGIQPAPDVRAESLATHSTTWRAIGIIAGAVRADCIERKNATCWQKPLAALATIDWRRTNPEFVKAGIVVPDKDGRLQAKSDRQAKDAMVKYLYNTLGLTISLKGMVGAPVAVPHTSTAELLAELEQSAKTVPARKTRKTTSAPAKVAA